MVIGRGGSIASGYTMGVSSVRVISQWWQCGCVVTSVAADLCRSHHSLSRGGRAFEAARPIVYVTFPNLYSFCLMSDGSYVFSQTASTG
jgi:hypothetical protein